MELMTRFYRQFGWPEAPSSEAAHVVCQCSNGVVMALYAAESYERTLGAMAGGFRGFSLCINCRDWDEVEAVYEAIAGYFDGAQAPARAFGERARRIAETKKPRPRPLGDHERLARRRRG